MMDEFEDNEIGRLLRLKKYEQPPPGYFENFLHEFHRRQRDELLRQPLWKIALGRAQDFMMSLNVARLASYPVAATAVLLCAAVISIKIYQTPPSPNVARIAPIVPAQSATDGGWSLASRSPLASPSLNHVRISRLTGRLRLRVMCWTACL